MDVTILQAIQISVWCLFTLRETVIISKTTHIKEKGATASGFTPLACKKGHFFFVEIYDLNFLLLAVFNNHYLEILT